MEVLKIKKLHPDAHIPTRAHDTDAGMDLYVISACDSYDVETHRLKNNMKKLWFGASEQDYDRTILFEPHQTIMLRTGIAVEIPIGYMGCIYARSGLSSKKCLSPVNAVGIIDSEYRGEIMVPPHNYSKFPQIIDVGERIAQLVIQPISLCTPVEVEELDETDRGVGGLGSTGTR